MRWIVLSGLMGGLWLCVIGCNQSSTRGKEDTEIEGAEPDTAQRDADSDADWDADGDTDNVADMDGDSDLDADGDNDSDAPSQVDTNVDGDTDNDADMDGDSDSDTHVDIHSDTDGEMDTDADTVTDTDADTRADTHSDTDGDTDTDADSDSHSDSDTDTFVSDNPAPAENFTQEVSGVSFDMIYVPGGTFTLGCESDPCPDDTAPVSGVTVSSYYIGKNEVTTELWNAVMGESSSEPGDLSMSWYEAMEFACQLSQMTGRAYRMMTEAEFEYAAKNHLSSLEDIGSGEEWAYNSWSTTHTGGTDPVGPDSGKHTQKTRRDPEETVDSITGRLIRSIDGIGPQLRLVISEETDLPPDYVPPCNDGYIFDYWHGHPENSYRDPRWVTGSDAHWVAGPAMGYGTMDLRVWEDGTASQDGTNGQWFTSNNIVFVFVPDSGESITYQYIFLDETQGSLLSEGGFMDGFIGRIEKEAESGSKPTVSGLQSGAELAAAAGDNYKRVDMENIPESAKRQDPRLLNGPTEGWFQNNMDVGGTHNYRKDVDTDEFRFVVIDRGEVTMLANGDWFTVNDTFLRVTHSGGYVTDYLYAFSSDGETFYHSSYQGYERADFRMFEIYSNTSGNFPPSCIGNSCSEEIPKGQDASDFSTEEGGQSTFEPAPCPVGGCE